ncbi:MAG: hemerythrin domain-containing protein [Patescibacteria group bacterium]
MRETTKILSAEHQNILKMLDALLKECAALESGQQLKKSFFEKAVEFIKHYADKFHHAKEEDILFVELNKPEAQMHCNPTGQMLYEHDLGRGFVKGLEEGLSTDDAAKIIENARNYAQLLQEHIFKEDNILYPMADAALTEEIEVAMLKKFRQVEEEKFGREVIEKYITLINEVSGQD